MDIAFSIGMGEGLELPVGGDIIFVAAQEGKDCCALPPRALRRGAAGGLGGVSIAEATSDGKADEYLGQDVVTG